MGNKSSGRAPLEKERIEELHGKTHYQRSEVKQLYKQFSGQAPSGAPTEVEFTALSQSIGIRDPFVTKMAFSAFDRKRRGSIDFADFVHGMSIMTQAAALPALLPPSPPPLG